MRYRLEASDQRAVKPFRPGAAGLLPLLLVLLFFSGDLARGGDEGDDELVMEFNRFYSRDRSVRERMEAIYVLKGVNTLEATRALVRAFDDDAFQVRVAAIETMGSYRDPDSITFLVEKYIANKREKKVHRLACAAEILGYMKAEAAIEPLGELFRKTRDWELKRAIAGALGGIGSEKGVPVLVGLLADKDPTLRIVALDALAGINRPDLCAEAVVDSMEKDANWQVRAAAIAAARTMKFKEAIQPLINRLREESGRLRGDAFEALKEITFNDYLEDPEVWQKYWDRVADTWEPPDYEKIKELREKRKKEGTRYTNPAAQFAGIPTKSRNIIFVIDISGSMETRVSDIERFRASGREYRSYQRLEIVKVELMNTITNLDTKVNFNILIFATKVKWWKKRLVSNNILNKNSAIKFVEGLKPIGGAMAGFRSRTGLRTGAVEEGKTNTYAALMAALGVQQDKAKRTGYDRNLKSNVDTIYFLSDGAPTVGKVIDKEEIRMEVKRVNRVRKIVIHAIAIGDFQKDFMKALAKENGGVYVDLGE